MTVRSLSEYAAAARGKNFVTVSFTAPLAKSSPPGTRKSLTGIWAIGLFA